MNRDVLYIAAYNSIVVITFCLLAYVFDKWWIVLFGLLFWATYKNKNEDD